MMEGTRNSHMGKQAAFPKTGRAVSCEMLYRKSKDAATWGVLSSCPSYFGISFGKVTWELG